MADDQPSIATSIPPFRAWPRCCRISTRCGARWWSGAASMTALDQLPEQRPAHHPRRLARRRAAGRRHAGPAAGARRSTPFGTGIAILQLPLRRAAAVQRGPRRALSPRGERLDRRASGSTAIRACAPRSWSRCRTPNGRSTRSSVRAGDRRFVQVLMLVMGEMPLGRRQYWPIYAAAERHGLPIGIHAGSSYRHPLTPVGWPSDLHRGLRQPGAGLPVAADQPDRRGRVRQIPRS